MTTDYPPAPNPDRGYPCPAHGEMGCGWCARTAQGGLIDEPPASWWACRGCETYRHHGVHWDTCQYRLRDMQADPPIPLVAGASEGRIVHTDTTCICHCEFFYLANPAATQLGDDGRVHRLTACDVVPPDLVNHPPHYTNNPSGVECITVTEHLGFCIGNAIKYLWRADEKDNAVEDLRKAAWYVQREIERREKAAQR